VVIHPCDRVPVQLELRDHGGGKIDPAGAKLRKRGRPLARPLQKLKQPQLLDIDERHRLIVTPTRLGGTSSWSIRLHPPAQTTDIDWCLRYRAGLLGTEAVCVLLDIAGVRELVEAHRDAFGIEIQASGEVASGALRVAGEKPGDTRGRVALTAARGGAPRTRASRGGAADRASRQSRGTALAAKLVDLLLQPSQALPGDNPICVHTGSRTRNYRVCDRCLVDDVA
jgi:hypothetical protein